MPSVAVTASMPVLAVWAKVVSRTSPLVATKVAGPLTS
jgi:hypothetical protein